MPSFSSTTKEAVLISPLENWTPTWNLEGYLTYLERAGYHVNLIFNENASIAFLKTELTKYDLIILRTDSFYYEGLNYYCSWEPVTSRSRAFYAEEISAHEMRVGVCVGFSLIFLQHNYPPGSLKPGLVLAVGGGSLELTTAFITAGASVFIGYFDMYSLYWGRLDALTTKILSYLSEGSTVKDSMLLLYKYLARGHGQSSTLPSIYWNGNGDFTI